MNVSLANSIRFYLADDNPYNFDNRAYRDAQMLNHLIYDYCQKFWCDDSVDLQIKVASGTAAPTCTVYIESGATDVLTATLKTSYTAYDYYEITLSMGDYTGQRFYIEIKQTVSLIETRYLSNTIESLSDYPEELLSIQWHNVDNAFEVDYSTGLVCGLRVEGIMRLSEEAAGEQSIYDNQEELVKLFEEVKRVMTLRVPHLPEQMLEQLRVAVAHDRLFINGVEYTAEGLPQYALDEFANTGEFRVDLTQKNIIGLNTHDVGYDADRGDTINSMVLQELNANGPFTLTVPQGYLIQSLTALYNAGTGVVLRAGTDVDRNNIVYDTQLRSAADNFTETVNVDYAPAADTDLYVGIDGRGLDVDVYVILLKNRQ